MKQLFSLLLVLCLCFGMAACGGSADSSAAAGGSSAASLAQESSSAAASSFALPEDVVDAVSYTMDSPIPIGQWVKFPLFSDVDGTYPPVYVRVNKIVRGSEDMQAIQDAVDVSNGNSSEFAQIDLSAERPADVEWRMVEYEVCVPEDYPSNDGVISTPTVNFRCKNALGWVPSQTAGVGYSDLVESSTSYAQLLSLYGEGEQYGSTCNVGQYYTFRAIFPMVIGYDEFCLSASYMEDNQTVEIYFSVI